MKTQSLVLAVGFILFLTACKKEDNEKNGASGQSMEYSSLADFYSRNGAMLQTYAVDASTGGSFTTPQGTLVTIPPQAFRTMSNGMVTGSVTVQFKDIYKTSDMLLSDKPTNLITGAPLKSGGEFFIKAIQNNEPLKLESSTGILIDQPVANTAGNDSADFGMRPFLGNQAIDSSGDAIFGWKQCFGCSVTTQAASYLYSLYQFSTPEDSGTWCNSDDPTFFGAYTQTTLTIHPSNVDDTLEVFLIFQGLNSMIHVYNFSNFDFVYQFAPLGLSCTIVGISVKNGKLHSCFTPITITNNSTVDITVSETTTEAFRETLRALD